MEPANDSLVQALIESTLTELKEYPFLLSKADMKRILKTRHETVNALWNDMPVVGGERSKIPKIVFIDYLIRKGREGSLAL